MKKSLQLVGVGLLALLLVIVLLWNGGVLGTKDAHKNEDLLKGQVKTTEQLPKK